MKPSVKWKSAARPTPSAFMMGMAQVMRLPLLAWKTKAMVCMPSLCMITIILVKPANYLLTLAIIPGRMRLRSTRRWNLKCGAAMLRLRPLISRPHLPVLNRNTVIFVKKGRQVPGNLRPPTSPLIRYFWMAKDTSLLPMKAATVLVMWTGRSSMKFRMLPILRCACWRTAKPPSRSIRSLPGLT